MAKILAKLFRDPRTAKKALDGLKKHGFKDEEIGIIIKRNGHQKLTHSHHTVTFPGTGELVIHGPVKSFLDEASKNTENPALAPALTIGLGLTDEATSYFEFGISAGGVLLTIHTADDRANQAREVLRQTTAEPVSTNPEERSPGFYQAGRMSATDPVDAPMSGDFRKY